MKLFTLVSVFVMQAVCTEAGMFAPRNAGGLLDGGGQGDEGRIMRRTVPAEAVEVRMPTSYDSELR